MTEAPDRRESPPTYGSTVMANVAYKRSSREKVETRITDSEKTRGSLRCGGCQRSLTASRRAPRVIDILPRFGWISTMGADAPLFLKKGGNRLE